MDYYDAAQRWGDGDLAAACERIQAEVHLASFSSDWLYTPSATREFAEAMCRAGKPVTYLDVESPYGHDAFLVEVDKVGRILRGVLGETP
jgi:homoserine O-acetyltransferase